MKKSNKNKNETPVFIYGPPNAFNEDTIESVRIYLKAKSNNFDKEKFMEQYKICIDENGNPRACGRKEMIKLLNIIDDSYFGNKITGVIQIKRVNKLYLECEKDN